MNAAKYIQLRLQTRAYWARLASKKLKETDPFDVSCGVTQYRLAKAIGVSQARIAEIIAGKRAITVNTGLRLSRYSGLNDAFWTGLQMDYDTGTQRNGWLSHSLKLNHRIRRQLREF